MTVAELRAALLVEQQRRASAEGRLQRALENNGALARNNLRLQEQLARLRGEADVRQHEQGCQRAAAAARQSEAAAKLAALQERLQQAAADKAALLSQLAGKQQVIVDLQRKLAALSSSSAGQVAAGGSGSAGGSSSSLTTAAPNQDDSFEASAGSLATLSIADAAAAPGQPLGDLSEGEEAPEDGTEASSASPAATASPAAAQQPAGCADQVTPMAPAQQTPPSEQDSRSGAPPPTGLRSSLRARNAVGYTQPSLRSKLRQGDPFTFGAAEAAAAGGAGGKRGRARTKPRPRFAASVNSSGAGGPALPPVAD